jgi:hypothetical protein
MSPLATAQVQAALRGVFGQDGGQDLGQAISRAVDLAFGQAAGYGSGQPGGPGPGQPGGPGDDAAGWPEMPQAGPRAPGTPHGGFDPAAAAQFIASHGGERATAVVLAARDVAPPGFPAPGGMADLTLEVTRADGSVYTAVTRLGFSAPERKQAIAVPGTRLRVRIDPADPARVAIDTSGMF